MNIVNKFIAAVSDCGIPCQGEFSDYRIDILQKPLCAFVGVKKFSLNGNETVPTVQVRITLQGSEKRIDGALLTETAENVIIPAVTKCGESIAETEISEVKLNTKTGMLYCEIIFKISPPEESGGEEKSPEKAAFKGITVLAEEYSFSRSALTAETALISGGTLLNFGGVGAIKIKLSGTVADNADIIATVHTLDLLLTGGEGFSLVCGGAGFDKVILSKYSLDGEKGEAEKVQLEFIGTCGVSAVPKEG